LKLKIKSQGWSLIFSIGAMVCLILLIQFFERAMHHAKLCKVLQMIAQRSPREYLRIVRSQSGRQDSNLRPSAPKALEMFFKRFLRTIDITD